MNGRSQSVRLPKEFRLPGRLVSIRKVGDGVLLEPLRESAWPEGYFENIVIKDKRFKRPSQGATPPAASLDS